MTKDDFREIAIKELERRVLEHDAIREVWPGIAELLTRISRGEPGDHARTARLCLAAYERKRIEAGLCPTR